MLNETIADETAFYDDDLDKEVNKKVCIDSPDSSSNEKINVKSIYNSDNTDTDNDTDNEEINKNCEEVNENCEEVNENCEEINEKLIEKNNLLNKIMEDLESS